MIYEIIDIFSNPASSVNTQIRVIENSSPFLYNGPMSYKVVELSTVTDEEIEKVLNEWTSRGWTFSSIHFVNAESSRRPKMAFLFFVQPGGHDDPGAHQP